VVLHQLNSFPLFRTPQLDSQEYLRWARQIASGDFSLPVPLPHGPGYPFFLGALLWAFGGSLVAARICQALVGALLCLLVARLGARQFGPPAGRFAGFLLAAYGPLILVEVSFFAEGILLVLLVLLLGVLLFPVRRPLSAAAGGLLQSLAILVRSTAIVLLPLVLVAVFLAGRDRARSWLLPAIALAGALLPLTPVVCANLSGGQGFTPMQGYGGMNFFLGNSPRGSGLPTARSTGAWDTLDGEAARHGIVQPDEQDAYYYGKTLREIRESPLAALRLLFRKLVWSLQADEIRDSHSLAFFETPNSLLRFLPGFGLLLPLAALGIWETHIARPRPWLLDVYLVLMLATCVFLVVGMRYRIPLVPVLALFGGFGAWKAVSALRPIRSRLTTAGVLLGAAALSHVWAHGPSHLFAEEWTFTASALESEEDLPGAVEACDRALVEDPNWSDAWATLGEILPRQGKEAEALQALRTAVRLGPDSHRNHLALGRFQLEHGRPSEAISQLSAAAAIEPADSSVLESLCQPSLALVEPAGEAKRCWRLLSLNPSSPAAHLSLAELDGARGRPRQGLAHAQEAVRIGPGNAQAWLLLAVLAVDAGERSLAESALQKSLVLGGDSRGIAIVRARLLRAAFGKLPEWPRSEGRPFPQVRSPRPG
jgi:tetratricopeptide (TPR) repeat protein